MIDIQPLNEQRLAPLMPAFVSKVRAMIAECETKLDPMLITQGLRTWDQQHALYMQGRVGLLVVNALRKNVGWAPLVQIDNEHTVTNADAGTSFHNFGVAIDVVPITNIGQPDWCDSHPDWQIIIAAAANQGLEHGDRGFHDNPHFQFVNGTTPALLKSLYKSGDLSDCWAEVMKNITT